MSRSGAVVLSASGVRVSRARVSCPLLLIVLTVTAAGMLGCSPDLLPVTVPPPGAVAELDKAEETITLTRGIALGLQCTYQGPCVDASAEVADTTVASVYPAYVDLMATEGYTPSSRARTVFVLVGNQAGSTTLNVTTEDGDVSYVVDIVVP
ncbi:hypothetical protein [Chondromyces apiculatus]|uniref:Uncharacterized protein n=1 Tax=Chondromyces apiculatus DSM 436 TaxID=1192034 RepID=A0A017TGA5_9BACT|nr:hypothetical protein [Chondromyces apiculatus]EYF07855.1 Hypothetical protein CAP_6877 [Chondromyces apiculatus DSM 436]